VVGGHQMRDTAGYGRIYRITPKNSKLVNPVINLSTVNGQLAALNSPAVNVRFMASEKLRSRGASIIPQVKNLLDDSNPFHQARAIWLLSRLGDEGIAEVERMLDHDDENIRLVAFRSLRQSRLNIPAYAEKLAADPSAFVRREVIIALGDLPFDQTKTVLLQLADGYNGKDRWYLEALGTVLKGHESEIYPEIIKKFKGREVAPDQWDEKLASLVWRLHPPAAVNDLKARGASTSLSEANRSQALTALGFINTPSAVQAMTSLSKSNDPYIAGQATYWLSFRQGNDWFALSDWSKAGINAEHERKVTAMKVKRSRILDEHMPFAEKKWNARDMAKDAVGGQMLIALVAENKLPERLYPFVEELILKNTDAGVRIQASMYFKNAGGEKSFSIPAIAKMQGDISNGEDIFAKHCASCHRINKAGEDIGPDLTSINKKFDREGLLDAIINPNAGVVFGYEAWTINLADGQSFFGFLIADGAGTVVIKDLAGEKHIIATSKISSRKKQEKSLMPSASALGVSEQELADLSEYLMMLE
jgi:putative heme-binding domain-containing protein